MIFDDAIDDPDEFKSKALEKLSVQLRHYDITLFFSTHYCNALTRMRAPWVSLYFIQIIKIVRKLKYVLCHVYAPVVNHWIIPTIKDYVENKTGDHFPIKWNQLEIILKIIRV